MINRANKKLKCLGPCEWEPLSYNNGAGGTLKDGTTYSFTSTPGTTIIDDGQGGIEHGSSDDILTITFSREVDFEFTNTIAGANRGVWHGANTTTRLTRAITDGSSWCYEEGTVTAGIDLQGQTAQWDGVSPNVNAKSDWGSLQSYRVTVISMQAYVWDAYRYNARPITDKIERSICEVTNDLCRQIKSLHSNPVASAETLTSLSVNQANDQLTYIDENGNSNQIPLVHTMPVICNGPFVDETGRSGWLDTDSTIYTANSGTVTIMPYTRLGSGVMNSPDCVTDAEIKIDFGMYYHLHRRARLYSWVDYRVLVNGTVVATRTVDQYIYNDERTDTNPDVIESVQYRIEEAGNSVIVRNAIPANATVEVQAQYRINVNGSQGSAYFRSVGFGLRSNASAVFMPRTIVTGVL